MATSRSLDILKAIKQVNGAVSRTNEEGGVVRMKILVRRHELEQVLREVIKKRDDDNKENDVNTNNARRLTRSPASKSLEQRLEEMKKRQSFKASQAKGNCRCYWRPVLQSIPEEF